MDWVINEAEAIDAHGLGKFDHLWRVNHVVSLETLRNMMAFLEVGRVQISLPLNATVNVLVAHQRRHIPLYRLEHLPVASVVHEACNKGNTIWIRLFFQLNAMIVCKEVQSCLQAPRYDLYDCSIMFVPAELLAYILQLLC